MSVSANPIDHLDRLVKRAIAEHDAKPGADSETLAATEARIGYPLPDELRALLTAANGIQFWGSGDYPCELLSAEQITPANVALQDEEAEQNGLIAIAQVESDFVAIDLEPESTSYLKLVDCSHETFPDELFGICDTVAELLALVLDAGDEDWLWPAAMKYGVDYAED